MTRATQDRFGQSIEPESSDYFLYVPRSKQIVPTSPNAVRDSTGDTIPNPIGPISSDFFLYVPRAGLIVPYGAPPPSNTYYILSEASLDLATEDGVSFLRLETDN